MTTFIGRIGRMMPTGCVAEESIGHEQRSVVGGGAGTLAPRRVRVQGIGARTWGMTVAYHESEVNATLQSLARSQALYGGSYRVIPCDALRSNLMTPRMSDELHNWTNLTIGPQSSFPTVFPEVYPAMLGLFSSLSPAVSGSIPVPWESRMWAYMYLSGKGKLVIRGYNVHDQMTVQAEFPFDGATQIPRRVGGDFTPTSGTVSLRFSVEAESFPVHGFWPSVAYQDHPYSVGKGCDAAYITMPSRTPLKTTAGIERSREDISYEIVEVGV